MAHISLFLILWAVVAACFLGLLAYRGTITRYEEDQLFLSDNNKNEHDEQDEILRKVNRMRPIINAFGGIAGIVTVGIVGMFVWDAWQRLQ